MFVAFCDGVVALDCRGFGLGGYVVVEDSFVLRVKRETESTVDSSLCLRRLFSPRGSGLLIDAHGDDESLRKWGLGWGCRAALFDQDTAESVTYSSLAKDFADITRACGHGRISIPGNGCRETEVHAPVFTS